MNYRFRKISDRQLIGLYLFLHMVREHRDAVRLTSNALRSALGVDAVHRPRASALARDFAPYFLSFKIEDWVGRPRTILLKIAAVDNPQNPLTVDSWPSQEDAERFLGIDIVTFQTEWLRQEVLMHSSVNPR